MCFCSACDTPEAFSSLISNCGRTLINASMLLILVHIYTMTLSENVQPLDVECLPI